MQLRGPRARRRVATRQHNRQGNLAAANRLDHASIAAPDALFRERELAVAVAGSHIHAGEIEHHVGIRRVEHRGQVLL
jgi:hypothetical protein